MVELDTWWEGLASTVYGLTGRELVEEWQMSSVDLEDPWGLLVSIESEEEERIPIVGRGITIGRGKGVCVWDGGREGWRERGMEGYGTKAKWDVTRKSPSLLFVTP